MSDFMKVLGTHGVRLTELASPWLESSVDEVENKDLAYEKFFDGIAVLGDRQSPELKRWQSDKLGMRLRSRGSRVWNPPGCGWLYGSSRAEDGKWLIRLQSIFLPVSSVLSESEVYTTASWHPTEFGTSRVYVTHQDEPGVWHRFSSLSALLAWRTAKDVSLDLDDAKRAELLAAVEAQREADTAVFPEHLDPEALQVRTRWIAELLIGQHVTLQDTSKGLYYDRLEGIPPFETYAAERHLLAAWPHLAAYWLVHHAFLGNAEALADVLTLADDRYPPIPELREIAKAFTATGACIQLVGRGPHQALVRDVAHHNKGGMCAETLAKVKAEIDASKTLLAAAASTLEELRSRTDEATAVTLDLWTLVCDFAGNLKEGEARLMERIVPDAAARQGYRMRVSTGETTPFINLFTLLLRRVDSRWAPVFEGRFTAGADVDEDHADAAPGALVGWGKALGSFEALHERFEKVCTSAGRRRYLELAMVADAYPDEPKSVPFLLQETQDFLDEFGAWEMGTTSFAFLALLDRKHPKAIEGARGLLAEGALNGATWQFLRVLVEKVQLLELTELACAVKALVVRGYGRHDDGTRGSAVRAWARLDRARAVPALEEMLTNLPDTGSPCEEAQVLAGLLTADPKHTQARARARPVAQGLLVRNGEMEVGAASALVQAMEDAGLSEAWALRAAIPAT